MRTNGNCSWQYHSGQFRRHHAVYQFLPYLSVPVIQLSILSGNTLNLPPYYPNLAGGFTFGTLADELVKDSLLLDYEASSKVITDSAGSGLTVSRSIEIAYSKNNGVMVSYYPSIL